MHLHSTYHSLLDQVRLVSDQDDGELVPVLDSEDLLVKLVDLAGVGGPVTIKNAVNQTCHNQLCDQRNIVISDKT